MGGASFCGEEVLFCGEDVLSCGEDVLSCGEEGSLVWGWSSWWRAMLRVASWSP